MASEEAEKKIARWLVNAFILGFACGFILVLAATTCSYLWNA